MTDFLLGFRLLGNPKEGITDLRDQRGRGADEEDDEADTPNAMRIHEGKIDATDAQFGFSESYFLGAAAAAFALASTRSMHASTTLPWCTR